MLRNRHLVAEWFGAVLWFVCGFAFAEDAESSGKPAIVVPTIEVTAPRSVDEHRYDAVSATRVSSDVVEHGNLQNTNQLGSYIPNLTSNNGANRGNQIVGMRGFSNAFYFGDPTVGLYVDDMPIAEARAFNLDLYDVDYIEVLRGPQMTRKGKGAEVGQLNIVTRQPTSDFHGEASASYGVYNTQLYRAAVSGPIIKDKLLFRLSGLESRRDGYINNTESSKNPDYRQNLAGRIQLQYTPTKELEVSLTAQAQHADDGMPTYVLLSRPSMFKVTNDFNGEAQTGSYSGVLKAVYKADDFIVTSVTSRQSWALDDSKSDFDFTPNDLLVFFDEYEYVQWSQEFRVASPKKQNNWEWIAGTYYEDRTTEVDLGVTLPDAGLVQSIGIQLTAPVKDRQLAHMYARTYALFGEATYTAMENFDITFGLRLEHHLSKIARSRAFESRVDRTRMVTDPLRQEETDSFVALPKLSAAYHVTPNITTYASVSEGYRPGGFSQLTGIAGAFQYRPDFLWNFEVGLKSSWLNEKLIFDLSLFYDPVNDFQTRHQVAGGNFWVDNAKRASSRGFEAQLEARPIKGLDISAGFGYVDARFDSYFEPVDEVHYDGKTILLSPKYNYSLAVQYRHLCGFFGRAEFNGIGRFPLREDNIQYQQAYQLFNARLGYEREHFGVYIYGNNLLDRHYTGFGVPDVFGEGLVGSPGDPLTYGVMVQIKY